MLTKTAIAASYSLAGKVTRAQRVLGVNPGTVLFDLVQCCAARGFDLPTDEVAPAIEDLVEEASQASSGMDVSDHDLAHERAVDLGSKAVTFVFDLARNRVNPQIRAVADSAEAYVAQTELDAAEPLTIQPVFVGDVFRTMALADMVGRYKDMAPPTPAAIALTNVWPGSVLAAVGTGDSLLDGEITAHFKDEAAVRQVWTKTFGAEAGLYRDSDPFKAYPDLDSNLVVFLGSQRLIDAEPPEDLKISLAAYRAYLANLMAFAGTQINSMTKLASSQTQLRMLVLGKPSATDGLPKGIVRVNGDVYNRWLSEGGSPEALMGAVAAGNSMTYDSLLADAEANAALWNRRVGLYEASIRHRVQAATVSGLRRALIALATELLDEQLLPGGIETAIKMINERLEHFHPDDVRDVYSVARKAVCRVFYPHLPVEKILNAIDLAAANNPGMEMQEVAYLVLVDYVAGWVAGDICVSAADSVGAQNAMVI